MARAALRLPALSGAPVHVRFLPQLTARGNRMESATGRGNPVHAGSFLRKRELVLAHELLAHPRELARIFIHEVFHFVWIRAGNTRRAGFEGLLIGEMEHQARGELGWSAELRKQNLEVEDRRERTRRWREYLCESFCDTAAWFLSRHREHEEFTLAPRFRRRRAEWFQEYLRSGMLPY
ncbi:MAG: hypothetical protein JJE04_26790 [Acidobacteriia bacterium]|nr:hypothetical protein [Terriglobia bacterium]